ncbi:MAG: hypothetical protein JNN03_24035 [Rubrivivax sp.]|nr:hypothetical protein [Rubrivivax sp.]
MASTDDLGAIQLDEGTSVLAFTRNGWLNHRVEEIAQLHKIALLPTSEAPAVACDGASLDGLIADLAGFLARVRRDAHHLPPGAREEAEEDEVRSAAALAPASLEAAIAAFKAAAARDEDGERLETLLCLLWCQLRLAEHARANGLRYLCVRSR